MKILYLNLDRGIPILGDKGASVHVRAFVAAASALGHDIVLAYASLGEGNPPPPGRLLHLDYDPKESEIVAQADVSGRTLIPLTDPVLGRERARIAYDRTVPARLIGALDAIGFFPDLIYERHALFHRAGVEFAARLGVPRLLEVNAPLIEEQRKYRGLRMEHEARAAEAESYHRADAIIAVSDAVRAHVAAVLGRAERVHVVPNGVDLARFGASESGGAAIRERLGLNGAPIIGFIGSFKPWHGMLFLLDVFASLSAEHPDLHLLAVGEGPERDQVRVRAETLGLANRVVLPGRAPHADIPAWLRAMNITVAPYLPQADFYFSPLKIVESMAAGRPVVAPDIGQIGALIDDGVSGRLYPPGNESACRGALSALLRDPESRAVMGAQARARVAQCGWTEVVTRILDLAASRQLGETAA